MATVKQYVEFLHPGVMEQETFSEPIKARDHSKVRLPKGAHGYRFFERTEHTTGWGGKLLGQRKNHSGWTFLGTKMTLADVRKHLPHENVLIDNMKAKKIRAVVKTIHGQFLPLGARDRVIEKK